MPVASIPHGQREEPDSAVRRSLPPPPVSLVPSTPMTPRKVSHHRRHSSSSSGLRQVRESLHAMSVQLSDGSRKINQYRFLRCLGHGTFATVHLGEFTNEEGQLQLVAIKEFDKRRLRKKRHHDLPLHMRRNMRAMDAEDPLYLVRTEVAILKKMSHPHVVQLYEALDDPENDKLFLVFEYCAGGPLCHIEPGRQGERLAEDKARLYFRQILSGLEYMHANGIMHRDIKPDNILMSNELVCKISDFGVSKMIWESGSDLVHQSVGTPAFMSPELCHIGAVESHGYSDDVWALGITLYALLMGRLPFYRDDLFELYEAIQHDELCLKDCRASPACQDLLRSMLDKAEPNRISVPDMFKHPWVTDHGRDPMPPLTLTDDKAIDQVTEEDLHDAVFRISSMFAVACAVSKFKRAGSRHSSTSTLDGTESSEPTPLDSRKLSMDTPPLSDTSGAAAIPLVLSPVATMDAFHDSDCQEPEIYVSSPQAKHTNEQIP